MSIQSIDNNRAASVAVLFAPGTNCHEETVFAIELAGGQAEAVSLFDTLTGKKSLRDYAALALPGGFSYGDHIAAGRVFAVQLVSRLRDEVTRFVETKPVLGICNGYQVLMEMGLLPKKTPGARAGALAQNRSARFESRWVRLEVADSDSPWLDGIAGHVLRLPVAHAEGRMLLAPDESARAAFRYVGEGDQPTEDYPANPAGSHGGLAGTLDSSGLVLGMMPHPERASLAVQGSTDGLRLFENLVRMVKN